MRVTITSATSGQCAAMYAVWSASLNVLESEWMRLHTDAMTVTGSRCVTTTLASAYCARSSRSASPWWGDFNDHRPGARDWSTWSTSWWYEYASASSTASSHFPYVGMLASVSHSVLTKCCASSVTHSVGPSAGNKRMPLNPGLSASRHV